MVRFAGNGVMTQSSSPASLKHYVVQYRFPLFHIIVILVCDCGLRSLKTIVVILPNLLLYCTKTIKNKTKIQQKIFNKDNDFETEND